MMNLKRLFYRHDGSPRWWVPLVGLFPALIASYIIWEIVFFTDWFFHLYKISDDTCTLGIVFLGGLSVVILVVLPLYISLLPLMYSILFRKGIITSIFISIALATLWKYGMNGLSDKGAPSVACFSVNEAKNAGVFVCNLAVQPNPITNNNTSVLMGEAWIEKMSKPTTRFIWFPYRKIQSGYEIMIKREKIQANPNAPQNSDAMSIYPVGVNYLGSRSFYNVSIGEFAPSPASVYQFNILTNAPPVVLKPTFEERSK